MVAYIDGASLILRPCHPEHRHHARQIDTQQTMALPANPKRILLSRRPVQDAVLQPMRPLDVLDERTAGVVAVA